MTAVGLPSPSVLLGISKYESWYPGQERAFRSVLDWYHSSDRFLGLSLPTGSGKSLLSVLAARMLGVRTCILTATKGLQDQILREFSGLGIASVRGQNNFPCTLLPSVTAEVGPCHEGYSCDMPCPYRIQLRTALGAPIIVTNYAYYLAQTGHSTGLGDFGLLVCDEAHLAFGALESCLSVHLTDMDVAPAGLFLPSRWEWPQWKAWAGGALSTAVAFADGMDSRVRSMRKRLEPVPLLVSRALRSAKSLVSKLSRLASASSEWVVEGVSPGWRFTPRWVDAYVSLLYRDIPKAVLMSALLSQRTMDLLGVGGGGSMFSSASVFPSSNSPVWHLPTVRLDHRSGGDLDAWVARIDQIIQRRLDRKGIVFTVSYRRAAAVLRGSRYKGIMLSHSAADTASVVGRFRASPSPMVLVSPSITSGYDFPEDDCRYIVVGKVPYPNTVDAVTKARSRDDKDWSAFIAMETLVNESGRGSRSATDRCEVFIIDDNWRWFWPKYKHFAPAWFHDRVGGSLSSVPGPLV